MNTPEPNLSIYGNQDAMDDFPVLKAFQQYIDAEQAKARKRLIAVSIIFSVILIIVIGVFAVMLIGANDRNQTLNDRLIDYAMRESDRKAESAKQTAEHDATVRAMNETMSKLQQQIAQQQQAAIDAARKAADDLAAVQAQAQAQSLKPTPAMIALERRNQEEAAKLERANAALKAEKEALAKEKERLHKEEVERQRRRLYPEYYAKKDAEEAGTPLPRRKAVKKTVKNPTRPLPDAEDVEDDDIDDLLEDLADVKVKDEDDEEDDGEELKAVEYFKEDRYSIPVDIKGGKDGTKSRFRVPLK